MNKTISNYHYRGTTESAYLKVCTEWIIGIAID